MKRSTLPPALCLLALLLLLYRARFFGHKFDLSGVLHGGFLPGETRLARAA
jgi:hypothetical protein